jgi:hypothetical protein
VRPWAVERGARIGHHRGLSRIAEMERQVVARPAADSWSAPPDQPATPTLQLGVPLLLQRPVYPAVNLFPIPTLETDCIASLQECPDLFQAQPFACFHPDDQSPALNAPNGST